MSSTAKLAEAIMAEPWTADDVLEPVGKQQRDLVVGYLARLIDGKAADKAKREAADALDSIGTPAAKKVLAGLIDHEIVDLAKLAIENLTGKPADIVKALLARIDAIAKKGDDLYLLAVVEKLVEVAPKNKAVIAALAKHWAFGVTHETTFMASNAIFDALIEHAPTSVPAQAAFAAAVAHASEYGKVRGHGALALTGPAETITTHVRTLNAMKGLQPSGSSLRKSALTKLETARKDDLSKLAKEGDKLAAKLLK